MQMKMMSVRLPALHLASNNKSRKDLENCSWDKRQQRTPRTEARWCRKRMIRRLSKFNLYVEAPVLGDETEKNSQCPAQDLPCHKHLLGDEVFGQRLHTQGRCWRSKRVE